MLRHFISLKYFSKKKLLFLIKLAAEIKKNPEHFKDKLKEKRIGILFEKPSLRTKASFYIGSYELGAFPIYFSPFEVNLGKRESISDVARTLSKFLDCIVLRTFSHKTILELCKTSAIPVVNGLTDLLHPSQVLGDLFTLCELGKDLKKIKFTYIGDGNNVCHSLLYAFSILGGRITVATPKKYSPDSAIVEGAKNFSKISGAEINLVNDPFLAAKDADVIYTDVWVSMGKEKEKKERMKAFKKFQVNEEILKLAKKNCLIMHCLPAHRGEEIADSVLDSKNSIIFLQAENRLHSAKAILVYLLLK